MPSSARTAQLGLWREIVLKRHDETQSVNRHLDFIRERFKELELQAFSWSKESMLSIFLQLGLSESTDSPFSSVNKIIESRILQGCELSANDVEEVIRNEELKHKSRPLGLMDLPIEVFEKILKKLDCFARLEANSIQSEKRKRRVQVSRQDETASFAYSDHRSLISPYTYLKHRPPILNSIQTFALTSREIYQLCRPWLWRRLQFPTSLPASIDLWTKDILIRQGSYVRSLTLTLSSNCSKSHGQWDYPPFYDNLTTGLQNASQIEFISPKNIRALMNRCPNLSTLDIKFDYYDDINDSGGTEDFLIGLIPLLSSLKHLRHFALEDKNEEQMYMHKFSSKLISSLPLIESLVWNGSTPHGDSRKLGEDSFGSKLSKLKFLSRLHLVRFDDIGQDWCLYDWPKTLTDLSVSNYIFSSPSLAHQIIHHIAPNLTKLKIEFEGDDAWENFSLPLLTDLELSTDITNSLDSFRNCISIRSLHWSYFTPEHCRSLNRILIQSPWPHLSTLVVVPNFYVRYDPDGEHQEFEEQLVSLEKYCKQANLKFFIRRPSN